MRVRARVRVRGKGEGAGPVHEREGRVREVVTREIRSLTAAKTAPARMHHP
jgi:hypothetical protein